MSGICDTWSEYYDERTRTYSIPCEALFQGCGDESESNYEKLFGTPERAARTLARMCAIGDGSCAGCPMFKANLEHCKSDHTHLKSIVEWLRGDAE